MSAEMSIGGSTPSSKQRNKKMLSLSVPSQPTTTTSSPLPSARLPHGRTAPSSPLPEVHTGPSKMMMQATQDRNRLAAPVQILQPRSCPSTPDFSSTTTLRVAGQQDDATAHPSADTLNLRGQFAMRKRKSLPRLQTNPRLSLRSTIRCEDISSTPTLPSAATSTSSSQLDTAQSYWTAATDSPKPPLPEPSAATGAASGSLHLGGTTAGAPQGHIVRLVKRPEGDSGDEDYPYQFGPRQILPGVYLGSEENARDVRVLRDLEIGLIINVAAEVFLPYAARTNTSNETIPEEDEISPLSATLNRLSMVSSHKDSPRSTPLQASKTPPAATGSTPSRPQIVRSTISTPNFQATKKGSSESLDEKGKSKSMEYELPTVIDCPADPASGRHALRYLHLRWGHDQDQLVREFPALCDLIDSARAEGKKILCHCQCGVSRSSTLILGYVMRQAARSNDEGGLLTHCHGMHDAYVFVKAKSEWVGPNIGLVLQLVEWERVLAGKPASSLEEEDPFSPPDQMNSTPTEPTQISSSSSSDSHLSTPDSRWSEPVRIAQERQTSFDLLDDSNIEALKSERVSPMSLKHASPIPPLKMAVLTRASLNAPSPQSARADALLDSPLEVKMPGAFGAARQTEDERKAAHKRAFSTDLLRNTARRPSLADDAPAGR
ncbi:uncharacterized protein L969DRAFT_51772 [Mixia osmundae IAM 14324]|uniref:protein-tyrosine-phosphatase n=1 Tax=Mixia osmundae (strain CBS 9802 / IAM 14324 / JCM 22182 / KY 12970) TaxID=764103 RepID=G7E0N6_MIXOS|nr:uncharacterized protein L969DRAFT_51772 [Mixia osmundae IAM 14324]KEI37872.1 hypothetical protein L969DRAFT_51772 [Mixia osmundae IAM 14324]GAA96396.1 hypothetical protein E5Q_03063 [Mixia osmundae IAM 14324]